MNIFVAIQLFHFKSTEVLQLDGFQDERAPVGQEEVPGGLQDDAHRRVVRRAGAHSQGCQSLRLGAFLEQGSKEEVQEVHQNTEARVREAQAAPAREEEEPEVAKDDSHVGGAEVSHLKWQGGSGGEQEVQGELLDAWGCSAHLRKGRREWDGAREGKGMGLSPCR